MLMQIPRPIRYVTAMDVFDDARMREAAIHMSCGTDPNDALPFDSGLRGAAEIYGTRMPASRKALAPLCLAYLELMSHTALLLTPNSPCSTYSLDTTLFLDILSNDYSSSTIDKAKLFLPTLTKPTTKGVPVERPTPQPIPHPQPRNNILYSSTKALK